ncbi:hypothetical protein ACROYT_G016121 [Oculina patagonica]
MQAGSKRVVEAVTGTGGIYSLGFIHQNGYPIPRDSLQLAKSITGHWYISQNMVPEHFAFRKMNQETVFVRWKLAAEAKRHWRRSAESSQRSLKLSKAPSHKLLAGKLTGNQRFNRRNGGKSEQKIGKRKPHTFVLERLIPFDRTAGMEKQRVFPPPVGMTITASFSFNIV